MKPFGLLLLLLLLGSCNDTTTTPSPPTSEHPIRGTWQFEYFEHVETGKRDVPPAEMRPVTLSFVDTACGSEDPICGGRAPCNLYSARYKLHGIDGITIWDLFTTLIWCKWEEWEDRYYKALVDATRYRIRGTELKLYFDNGRKAAVFRWVPPQPGQ
jgi:heat shock protein HslJ